MYSQGRVGFLLDKGNPWLGSVIQDHFAVNSDRYTYEVFWDPSLASGFDVLFVLGYTKILSTKVIEDNGISLVIHESALPLGRGFSPVQWQILKGENVIPVCLIRLDTKVDSGDIYLRSEIKLDGSELLPEIRELQAEVTVSLIGNFLDYYPNITCEPQRGPTSFYRRRCRMDDELDVSQSIESQFNKLRITDNQRYPAFFKYKGHCYLLKIEKVFDYE